MISPSPPRRVCFYAGSFDPPTLGHFDVIARACRLCDRLVVAIGIHPGKAPLFAAEERAAMLEAEGRAIAVEAGVGFEVIRFADLAVDAARRVGATLMIRGLRDGSDLDYEMQLAGMNAALAPDIETVFVPASTAMRPITATLVRQIAALGGDVSSFVTPGVAARLAARFSTN